ncbi:MAG: hypothetical protein Q8L73_02160 [Methylotenera sp.]|nr:hypothetical protein [Methylotenera sp.]
MMKIMTKCLATWLVFCCATAVASDAYIQSVAKSWEVRPIITVGEAAANGYRMAGIPDGMGAFDNQDGSFTLLVNHEIAADKGDVRAHGAKGAFVSKWRVDVETLKVIDGSDLIQKVQLWDAKTKQYAQAGNFAFSRLCSADLARAGMFYDAASGAGYKEPLFLNGEEDKTTGRAFAHTLTGDSFELADLGKIQWENAVVNPMASAKTLVIGMDDNHDKGLLLVYVGQKRKVGNPAELAGLVGGKLYALKVDESRFSLVSLGDDVALKNINAFRAHALERKASTFARPEDGAWDTQNNHLFYFATTDKIDGNAQLFTLLFDDIQKPEQGGKIAVALNGTDIGAQMFDNLTVDEDGNVLIQEDPGSHERLAAIWRYDPKLNKTQKLFESNPELFKPGVAKFLTINEEHSGIIEVTALLKAASWFDKNKRYFLGNTQVHPQGEVDKALYLKHGQIWLISGPKTID